MRMERSGVDRPVLAQGFKAGRAEKLEHLRRGAEVADHAVEAAFALVDCHRAAQHRRNVGGLSQVRGELYGRGRRLAPLDDKSLGARHRVDHAAISLRRAVAEREDAMLVEDKSDHRWVLLVNLGRCLGEVETRLDIGHEAKGLAKNRIADRLAVLLIDQRQDSGRMGMVDEFVRQESVQQRLHRGVRRGRIDQVGALQRHHVFVGKALELARLEQGRELYRRQALRLDDAHVPAAALDAQNVPFVADQIGYSQLDRGVAAAMQNQSRLAAEQPRRINAQREFTLDA